MSENSAPVEFVKYVAIHRNTKISLIYIPIQATNPEISSAKIKNIHNKNKKKITKTRFIQFDNLFDFCISEHR